MIHQAHVVSAALLLILLFAAPLALAYQPASIPYADLVGDSELIVWAKLVAWEGNGYWDQSYTFEIKKSYKGEAPETIEVHFVAEGRGPSFGPRELFEEGFAFLKKDAEGHLQPTANERSWWSHKYVLEPGYSSFGYVRLGEPLKELPEELTALKTKKSVLERRLDGSEVTLEAEFYPLDEVDALAREYSKGAVNNLFLSKK